MTLPKFKSNSPWCLLLLGSLLLAAGCVGTVTPKVVVPTAPMADGTNFNSGFIGFDAEGYGIITTNAAARYEALRVRYGTNQLSTVTASQGITPGPSNGVVRIDAEHLAYWMQWTLFYNNAK